MITQDQVKKLFKYVDGDLFYRKRTKCRNKAGCMQHGRLVIGINYKYYFNHQLIFLMYHGFLPEETDHIDGNPLNNRIENLRGCTKSQNQHNRKINKNNKSGVKGVYWNKKLEKWQTQVRKDNVPIYLGLFDDKEVAEQVVRIARLKLHGEFANHG